MDFFVRLVYSFYSIRFFRETAVYCICFLWGSSTARMERPVSAPLLSAYRTTDQRGIHPPPYPSLTPSLALHHIPHPLPHYRTPSLPDAPALNPPPFPHTKYLSFPPHSPHSPPDFPSLPISWSLPPYPTLSHLLLIPLPYSSSPSIPVPPTPQPSPSITLLRTLTLSFPLSTLTPFFLSFPLLLCS